MVSQEHKVDSLVQDILNIAWKAGRRIVEVYGGDYAVCTKDDNTPLTTADLAAHDIILSELRKLDPDTPILSEESDSVPFSERNRWQRYWLVDPLDGTREFLKRNGEFTVNIALIEHGVPVLGVIVAPVLEVSYFAVSGSGAWKQIRDQAPQPIHVRRVPQGHLTVARSRCPTTGPRMQRFLDRLGQHEEIPMGAALKSCLVAEGAADVYARLGPTGEWDTGAAQCIVKEAGGHFTDVRLRDLRYNTRESLINPHFLVFGDKAVPWADYIPADSPV